MAILHINFIGQSSMLKVGVGVNGTPTHMMHTRNEMFTLPISPLPSRVFNGIRYGDGLQYQGTMVVGGMASYYAILARETGANARGGSGDCAKLTPTSQVSWGYWHFYIPVTEAFSLSFWHKISSGWNGSLKVSIYDVDHTSILLNSETVPITDDGVYHLYTSSPCNPSAIGVCLVRIEVINGLTDGYVFIDDIMS